MNIKTEIAKKTDKIRQMIILKITRIFFHRHRLVVLIGRQRQGRSSNPTSRRLRRELRLGMGRGWLFQHAQQANGRVLHFFLPSFLSSFLSSFLASTLFSFLPSYLPPFLPRHHVSKCRIGFVVVRNERLCPSIVRSVGLSVAWIFSKVGQSLPPLYVRAYILALQSIPDYPDHSPKKGLSTFFFLTNFHP